MNKTVPFSMRLGEDLKRRLQELARAQNRSLTNYIETALIELANRENVEERDESGILARMPQASDLPSGHL